MDPIKISIKPLSVNKAWQGRRFKTPAYIQYEKKILLSLPSLNLPAPPYKIFFEWGFSNKLADWDNPIKPLQDCLQKKYGFNDKNIIEAVVRKVIVKPNEDYILFYISHTEYNSPTLLKNNI